MERDTAKVTGRKHWLVLTALGLVWGSTWPVSDAWSAYVPPLLGAAVRFLLASLVLLPWVAWKRYRLPRGREAAGLLLLSVTMIVLPALLLFSAQQLVPSVTMAVGFAAMPLIVVWLTPLFAQTAVPRSAVQSALVGWGGMILALSATFFMAQAGGAAVVLLAVFSTAASLLWARRLTEGFHPAVVTICVLGAAAPLFWLTSAWLERGQTAQWNTHALAAAAFLALVPGALAYTAWFWLLQRMEAYQLATVQWLEPLAALVEGLMFVRAGWTWTMLGGCFVTGASLWMMMRARPEDDQSVSLWSNR